MAPVGIIAYVAPSSVGTIEAQIEMVREHVPREDWIRVDRPHKDGRLPRPERDFVFAHLLRTGDKLVVASVDVLGDNRADVTTLFRTLHGMGVTLVALADGLDGDEGGTEYAVRWIKALERAEGRWKRRVKRKRRRKGEKPLGRRAALVPADYPELVRLREQQRMTWPQIEAHYAAAGRIIKQSTLRAHYDRATQGGQVIG